VIDASLDNSCQAKSNENGFLLGYYIEKGARYFWGKNNKILRIFKAIRIHKIHENRCFGAWTLMNINELS